jgi:hypothetical protein
MRRVRHRFGLTMVPLAPIEPHGGMWGCCAAGASNLVAWLDLATIRDTDEPKRAGFVPVAQAAETRRALARFAIGYRPKLDGLASNLVV